jgi:hypothetical protein
MRWTFAGGAGLLSALLLAAQPGAPTFDSVLKEMLVLVERMTGTLANVKDEASAAAAKADLEKTAQRFIEIRKQAEAMKPPDKKQREELIREYTQKLVEAQKKLFIEISRVSQVPGGKDVLQVLAGVMKPKDKK